MRWRWTPSVLLVMIMMILTPHQDSAVAATAGQDTPPAAATATAAATGSRILFVSPIASKSHKGFFTTFIDKLADNGHHVTVITPFKPTKVRDSVREIFLDGIDLTRILPNPFEDSATAPLKVMSAIPKFCSDALERKEVQDLLKEEFDLGMISVFVSDCFLSLFYRLQIPFVQVSPAGLLGPMTDMIGNPSFPSFVHNPFVSNFHPFTFSQRLLNTAVDTFSSALVAYSVIPKSDAECRARGLCPDDMPSLIEMRKKSSLMIVNSVRTLEYPPRPIVPAVIHVGGIHCKESKPLPKDLEKWVAGAGDEGFIFFSLGSVVKPSGMPKEYLKILVKVFGTLKQRVLWKWDQDTMEDLPPNVRLGKWLPQQDILGDPRLRVFITHGGALSTQESVYHGTPVIGLPVFADQMSNMAEVQQQGWGRVLKWAELTPQLLQETLHFVMTDPNLREVVKRRSSLMRDQLNSPAQVANYWTEYVIRHNGAPHLQSPLLSMSWYKLYNVDVWLTILATTLLVSYLLMKSLLALCRCLCASKSKAKKD